MFKVWYYDMLVKIIGVIEKFSVMLVWIFLLGIGILTWYVMLKLFL